MIQARATPAERPRGKRCRDIATAEPARRHRHEGREQDQMRLGRAGARHQRTRHDELQAGGAGVDPGADAPGCDHCQHRCRDERQRHHSDGDRAGHRRSQWSARTSAGTSGTATANAAGSDSPGWAPATRTRPFCDDSRPSAGARACERTTTSSRPSNATDAPAADHPAGPDLRHAGDGSPAATRSPRPRTRERCRAASAAPRCSCARSPPAARRR